MPASPDPGGVRASGERTPEEKIAGERISGTRIPAGEGICKARISGERIAKGKISPKSSPPDKYLKVHVLHPVST